MSTLRDFEDIANVLRNYDDISLTDEKSNFRNGQGENAPIILYTKKLDNHTQIVAEAVTDGKKGKCVLYRLIKQNCKNEKAVPPRMGAQLRYAHLGRVKSTAIVISIHHFSENVNT